MKYILIDVLRFNICKQKKMMTGGIDMNWVDLI